MYDTLPAKLHDLPTQISAPALASLQLLRYAHLKLHWQGAHVSGGDSLHGQTGGKARDQKPLGIHLFIVYS